MSNEGLKKYLLTETFFIIGSCLEYAPPRTGGHANILTPLRGEEYIYIYIYTKYEVTVARRGGVIAI